MSDLLSYLEQIPDPPAPPPYTHARLSDPPTSKAAGEAVKEYEGVIGRKALELLIDAESHGADGATVHELAMRWAYEPGANVPPENILARRVTTLQAHGYVRATGAERRGGRGRDQQVHASTPEGRAWLNEGDR